MAVQFPAELQSVRFRQSLSLWERWHGASRDGEGEPATPRGSAVPQIHDRPAQGSKLHRAVVCKKEDRSLLCRKHRRVARIKESI